MKRRLFLWINLSAWFLLLGGIIFDQILSANWKSGSIEDIKRLNDFFHVTNPGYYFIVKYLVFIFSIASLIAFWKVSRNIRTLLIMGTFTIIADFTFTALHFDPIIAYVSSPQIDPISARQKASAFFNLNYLRILLDLFGVCVAARALHKSYIDN